jgi:DNA helicase-2/ATP-dependent DNA helicase PcrA
MAHQGQELLADLTSAQQEAVTHFEGPLLILAAAGSGKTRVITRRVAWLLQQGVRAGNILAITFTNKAAGEMRQRIETLIPGNRVWVSTFHSMGARLLRQYADRLEIERNFTIYDTDDQARVVKQALDAADLDTTRFSPERLGAAISKAKNQLITPEKFAQDATDYFSQTVARVYHFYRKKLRDANALDFDDLLYLPALALKRNEELRAELDARFCFVLIDEYQDTNHAQYQIAHLLSLDHRNLCVVGDPDQSIYKFRGSDIRNILDFETDFPDTKTVMLGNNFRSTPNILAAAGKLILHNRHRKKKPLITDNLPGEPVRVMTFDTGLDEADQIAARIKQSVSVGSATFKDFAVFVRINALTRAFESALIKHGIPYQIVKGLAFYERKETKDVLAYLRLLVNPNDNLSFLRAVNEPSRGVGKVSLEHLQGYAEAHEISLLAACAHVAQIPAIKGKAVAGLKEFTRLIDELRGSLETAPDELIRHVIDRSGYRALLESSREEEDADRLANVEELVTAAKQFAAQDPALTIADFLEQITLSSDVDGWDERQDCVSVMTLHSSKGLEFPIVYIMAVEEGILPHERSQHDEHEKEEERRLLFVGMTRAMKELHLSHARLRDFRGRSLYTIPSGFLNELPEDIDHLEMSQHAGRAPAHDYWRAGGSVAAKKSWEDAGVVSSTATVNSDYSIGQVVQHDSYGIGKVTDVSGFGSLRKIRIRFVTQGEKTFIADKVKLKVVPKK